VEATDNNVLTKNIKYNFLIHYTVYQTQFLKHLPVKDIAVPGEHFGVRTPKAYGIVNFNALPHLGEI